MKIGISTKNPLKIKAVKEVFEQAFGKVEVISFENNSGVPDQPLKDQILEGAKNRAKAALKNNDFSVGIEAGAIEIDGRLFDIGYCIIMDKSGKYSIGSQPIFELPESFKEKLLSGKELGKVADDFFGLDNIKQDIGAVGMLSKKLIVREDLLKAAVKTALLPWISKDVYD